ncbi:hypothetical protein GGR26_002493 [Lewinella marina]|nr:hypothetical protein [Neolewinella marina]
MAPTSLPSAPLSVRPRSAAQRHRRRKGTRVPAGKGHPPDGLRLEEKYQHEVRESRLLQRTTTIIGLLVAIIVVILLSLRFNFEGSL